MKKRKNIWKEIDKCKVALFFNNNIPLKLIGKYFDRSVTSINHILERADIRKVLKQERRKGLKASLVQWNIKKMEELCRENGLVEDLFSWKSHLPSQHESLKWQKVAVEIYKSKKNFKKVLSRENKHIYTFCCLKQIIDSLKEMGISVSSLSYPDRFGEDLYVVDKKILTSAQMLVMFNRLREQKGLPIPIMVDGVTYEG